MRRSRKLCGGEAVFSQQSCDIFSKPSSWIAERSTNGGLRLERSEENGGPGACPREFLEIHHIECRKTPHYATFSRPLIDRPVLESSSKRLVSKQAVSLINSEFEEKRSVILNNLGCHPDQLLRGFRPLKREYLEKDNTKICSSFPYVGQSCNNREL